MAEVNADPVPTSPSRPRWRLPHPLTGSGLSALADRGTGWVLACLLSLAACGAWVADVAIRRAWFPAVTGAVESLPDAGAGIHGGRLQWPDAEARVLGAAPRFSLAVQPGSVAPTQAAELQLELAQRGFVVRGILGYLDASYPAALDLDLDRVQGKAAWGAWSWVIHTVGGMSVGLILFLTWLAEASALAPVLWLFGRAAGRDLRACPAWRLAAAGQCVPAAAAVMGLLGYGAGRLGLTTLAVVLLGHLATGLVWPIPGLFSRPRRDPVAARAGLNPFGSG